MAQDAQQGGEGAAGGGRGAHRDIWKEYRGYINEYEEKASELQLDVQAEAKALAAAREQLGNLNRECADLRGAAEKHNSATFAEQDAARALATVLQGEAEEHTRLAHQIAATTAKLQQDRGRFETQAGERQRHLEELEAHLEQLRAYVQQRIAAVGQQEGQQAALRLEDSGGDVDLSAWPNDQHHDQDNDNDDDNDRGMGGGAAGDERLLMTAEQLSPEDQPLPVGAGVGPDGDNGAGLQGLGEPALPGQQPVDEEEGGTGAGVQGQ